MDHADPGDDRHDGDTVLSAVHLPHDSPIVPLPAYLFSVCANIY